MQQMLLPQHHPQEAMHLVDAKNTGTQHGDEGKRVSGAGEVLELKTPKVWGGYLLWQIPIQQKKLVCTSRLLTFGAEG